MAVHDPAISGYEVAPGVAMAVARSASAAIDADRPAVALVAVRRGTSELRDIGAADVGMTVVDRYHQALAGRLRARSGKGCSARRRRNGEAGGETRRRYKA